MSVLELEAVCVQYGSRVALDHISVAFAPGVTTAVVGRSGSGKSTLLECFNGMVRPGRGNVRVFGAPIDYAHLPQLRRRLGYAVQGTGLFPHLSIESNIGLLARLERWPADRIRRRVQELLDLVELRRTVCARYPYELSGGEQQRAGLCRAMMLDPPVLLLDEPFGALDPITRGEIHSEFVRVQNAGKRTIVLVTHDLREAALLARRILVLDAGTVIQHGDTGEVIASPASPFVARLVGSQLGDVR